MKILCGHDKAIWSKAINEQYVMSATDKWIKWLRFECNFLS